MEKENLKDLSRQELVDALYNLMNDGGDSDQPQKPVHVPSKKQVASERRRLRHRAQVTRSVVLSVGALIVVAAIDEMLSGGWDLSLYTCTYGGQSRFTVRCEEV